VDKLRTASDPNTDPAELTELASDKDWVIRSYIARNPSASRETLIKLTSDKDFYVRSSIAANPSTTREILEILLLDPWIHDDVIKILVEKQSEQNKTF
jgi:hypothetical protein